MWGCIAQHITAQEHRLVPSLYVRVYRGKKKTKKEKSCSLIICEGVSCTGICVNFLKPFLHYMWGCIEEVDDPRLLKDVPSLYVRVYRERPERKLYKTSSLIICEGVSAESQISHTWNKCSLIICEGVSKMNEELEKLLKFPHYMWGCICDKSEWFFTEKGPSLYVRVYQCHTFIITR